LGKEFKHPRRKCPVCNYTVSYSNFKRHLRNAHPDKFGNEEAILAAEKQSDQAGLVGHIVDEDEDEEDEDDEDEGQNKVILALVYFHFIKKEKEMSVLSYFFNCNINLLN